MTIELPDVLVNAWSILPDRRCPCRRRCGKTVKIVCGPGFAEIGNWLPDKVLERPYDVDLLAQVLIYWNREAEGGQAPYMRVCDQMEAELTPYFGCSMGTCKRSGVGPCCSSHDRMLCHSCYRLTHFVEECSETCTQCEAECLPVIYPPKPVEEATPR